MEIGVRPLHSVREADRTDSWAIAEALDIWAPGVALGTIDQRRRLRRDVRGMRSEVLLRAPLVGPLVPSDSAASWSWFSRWRCLCCHHWFVAWRQRPWCRRSAAPLVDGQSPAVPPPGGIRTLPPGVFSSATGVASLIFNWLTIHSLQ